MNDPYKILTPEEKALSTDYQQKGVDADGNPVWVKTRSAIRRDNNGKDLVKGRPVVRRGHTG